MCNKNNVKKFVFASTIYVYSKQGYYYKCSKLSAELYIREFCKMNKLKYGILRYGSLYGPRCGEENGRDDGRPRHCGVVAHQCGAGLEAVQDARDPHEVVVAHGVEVPKARRMP
mgnify:CR=1 FL=1